MPFRLFLSLASLLIVVLGTSACAVNTPGSTRFRMTNQPCATNCSERTVSEQFPLSRVRHGIIVDTTGIFQNSSFEVVDLDAGVLSFIEFDGRIVNGKPSAVIDHGDVMLASDDLAHLGAIANSIWTSPTKVPTAQVGLDGFWGISILKGSEKRSESGMGNVGGAGLELAVTIGAIQQAQFVQSVPTHPGYYVSWSCYVYPLGGHPGIPTFYLQRSGGKRGGGDIATSFPIPSWDASSFHFSTSIAWRTCADVGRVL